MATIETVAQNPQMVTDMKRKVRDILISISWRDIAHKYFGQPSTWLYQKLEAADEHGNVVGFNEKETEQFKEALRDLARRLNKCADEI